MDYSLPGSSVHQISQARILKWVAISFSRGSSQPRDRTWVSCIGRRIFYHWATRKVLSECRFLRNNRPLALRFQASVLSCQASIFLPVIGRSLDAMLCTRYFTCAPRLFITIQSGRPHDCTWVTNKETDTERGQLLQVRDQVNTDPNVQLTSIWLHLHAINHWDSLSPQQTTASWLFFLSCSFTSKLIASVNSMMYKPISFHFYFWRDSCGIQGFSASTLLTRGAV